MKDLCIGDRVLCSATARPDYQEDGKRVLVREPRPKPFEAVVTGQARKRLGQYMPESQGYSSGYDPPDLDPPYLKVTETVLLWCVRQRTAGRELWVADADIESRY